MVYVKSIIFILLQSHQNKLLHYDTQNMCRQCKSHHNGIFGLKWIHWNNDLARYSLISHVKRHYLPPGIACYSESDPWGSLTTLQQCSPLGGLLISSLATPPLFFSITPPKLSKENAHFLCGVTLPHSPTAHHHPKKDLNGTHPWAVEARKTTWKHLLCEQSTWVHIMIILPYSIWYSCMIQTFLTGQIWKINTELQHSSHFHSTT